MLVNVVTCTSLYFRASSVNTGSFTEEEGTVGAMA